MFNLPRIGNALRPLTAALLGGLVWLCFAAIPAGAADPVKIGFKEPAPRQIGPNGEWRQTYFLFDTRRRGEGNQGHLYGTTLPPEQKGQLLEYLKTL